VIAEWREELPPPVAAPAAIAAAPRSTAATQEDIESFIARRLAERLAVRLEEIGLNQPFSGLGLDSIKAVEFLTELERWLGRTLSPTLFWNYPTIADLAGALAEPAPESAASQGTLV
jgi:acyl carrier protein